LCGVREDSYYNWSLSTGDEGKLLSSIALVSVRLRLPALHGNFNTQASHVNINLSLCDSARSFHNFFENDNSEAKRLVALSVDRNTAPFDFTELLVHSYFDILFGDTVRDVTQLASVRVDNFLVPLKGVSSLLFSDNFTHVEGSLSDRLGRASSCCDFSLTLGLFFLLLNLINFLLDLSNVFRFLSFGLLSLTLTVLGSEISFFHLDLVVGVPDVIALDHGESTVSSLSFESCADSELDNSSGFTFHEALGDVSLLN